MKVAFRTDASLQIGTGHVMRCLTLAKALDDRGAECTFLCRDHEGNLIEKIRREGFECVVLTQSAGANETQAVGELALAHADWLGTSWQCDARETISAIGAKKVDWLIVDHYALDKRWEEKLRPYAKKIMVIDDIADRPHDCDFLLDQNLVANFETRYQHLLPDHCATFLGPQYALLQPAYAELQTRTPPRMGSVQRILVFFGGGDQNNLTARAVSAIGKLKRHDIVLDVVMSSIDPNAAGVQAQAQQHANINVHGELPSLAPLMLQADLAIGGSGATSWERCCLGLPSLVITLADNQKPIAAELEARGLVRWLGHYDAVTDDMLIDALKAAIDASDLNSWSQACMSVTDGLGVERVASALALNSETKLKARLARLEDEALLLRWANDPLVRANAFNPEVIPAETHRKWFYERLRDPENCKIYIIETNEGLPIGQVRFQKVEDEWELHYLLAAIGRGRKIGYRMLIVAIDEFRASFDQVTILAQVKKDNKASQKALEQLGFHKEEIPGKLVYRNNFLSKRLAHAD